MSRFQIMYEAFIDLDELIVRCRDKQAKKFIKEAVACYRAGAYRSCIVATWNAVVFDFLHKLTELKLLGDKEALKLLEQFEKLSSEKKVKELWQFESDIPKKALNSFELISTVEMSDIERLFEDRSRCAHPSITSLEEPFEATAELARYHLRSAITHLLERPPVQGRAARERIFQDIKSEYFPTNPELAIKHFQKSPLARARLTLIKDVVLGLTVSLLTENLPEDERERQFSAINAISSMYLEQTREILNEKLSDIILTKVVDTNWDQVIAYLEKVKIWDSLSEACQLKTKIFLEKLDLFETHFNSEKRLSHQSVNVLLKSLRIDFLREDVVKKLQISLEHLLSIKELCKDTLLDEIINPFLEDKIPEATFNQLFLMKKQENQLLNQKIQPYLLEKLKVFPIKQLYFLRKSYEYNFLNEWIELSLQEKITKASLDELLTVREEYVNRILWDEDEKTKVGDLDDLHKLVEKFLVQRIKEVDVEELLMMKSKYSDDFFNNSLKPILKENVATIVDKFITSSSFVQAASHASLLVEVADYLSLVQWECILKAFCENNQIYGSYGCPNIFCSLLNKSIELSGSLQPYWISFREKLNNFNDSRIDKLKFLIDSYDAVE